jgi:capsular exopolysaccharide synthesis family protein
MIRVLQQDESITQSYAIHAGSVAETEHIRVLRPGSTPMAQEEGLQIVQRFFMVSDQESPRVVVFAGVDHGNGCSQVSAAVAEALAANTPSSVCLLEANFRSPSLLAMFGTSNEEGFSEALLREGHVRSFATRVSQDDLWLISSGTMPLQSPVSLGVANLERRLADLRKAFDYVIVDAPPLANYADALSLARWADGVMLVLEANSTRREAAQEAAETLRLAKVKVLGAVLNKRTQPIPKSFYSKL